MIKLNERLLKISAFINKNDSVIDVGCDHFLLGIYLYQKLNIKVVGSDINSGPLKQAKNNLKKLELDDKLELRLGNGLDTLTDDINTIIISGMGGETIMDILKNVNKHQNIKKLVISPNNLFKETREYINKLGYSIVKEEMILENNKYYLISEYNKNNIKDNYLFGKLDLNNEIVKSYYNNLYNTNLNIINKLPKKYIIKRIKLKLENYKIKSNIK